MSIEKINELESQIKQMQETIDKLKKENETKEKELVNYKLTRANYRQKYFYISKFTYGIGVDSTEDYLDNSMDNFNYKQFNYFIDEEKAARFAEHIRLTFELFQIRDIIRAGWEPDWNNVTQMKYSFVYNKHKNELTCIAHTVTCNMFSFQTEEKRDKFIQLVGEEKIIKYSSF